MRVVWLFGRSLAFYVGYIASVLLWGTPAFMFGLLIPQRHRFACIIVPWASFVLAWLRLTCGVTVKIQGQENLRSEPGILFVKHHSTWDTLFAQTLISPQTTVIKKSLLWIPCFGWAFAVCRPISIDRARKVSAIRQFVIQGQERLAQGIWVTVFPEGTRIASGEVGRFQAGGATLAAAAQAKVYVVAHTGSRVWPLRRFLKHPGSVTVSISEPIEAVDKSVPEINNLARSWMVNTMHELEASDRVDGSGSS